jgi:arsenite-transporting ATPase
MVSMLTGTLPDTTAATGTPGIPWLETVTRFLFFTGKGGVGKTTVASATAVRLAEAGRRVLIVSTDPASNLDDVFGLAASTAPTEVPGATGLWVANLDPVAAAAAYREQLVGPYRGVLPDAAVRSMEEQLSGACTVEIAAFNEFTALLADPAIIGRFDHVLFDTAPTGHTLRLLSLPSAWSDFLTTSSAGASCLGPLAGLEQHRARCAATVDALADAAQTTVVLVSRAEESPLREAARAGGELAALGVANQRLVLNGVLPLDDDVSTDEVASSLATRQQAALAAMPSPLRSLPAARIPLMASDLTGLDALRALAGVHPSVSEASAAVAAGAFDPTRSISGRFGDFDALVSAIVQDGSGVVMTMGKGGVGKTTLAARLARALAATGRRVHLSTTDPAAHVLDAVGDTRPEGLIVSRIDPAAETARYSAEVLAAAEEAAAPVGGLDADERAVLEEDLRSPCTEEIAVFRAFARTVAEAGDIADRVVVLDTAPTGHTLLLLDAAESYHREVARTAGAHIPEAVRALLPRLRDPRYTKMVLVTLAEATPVHEAARLQDDLRRAGIEPFGWVVNASLAASGTRHPLLAARARLEWSQLERVNALAKRGWLVPWATATDGAHVGMHTFTGTDRAIDAAAADRERDAE